jgi:GNAT superfamily N-acetyltransferase
MKLTGALNAIRFGQVRQRLLSRFNRLGFAQVLFYYVMTEGEYEGDPAWAERFSEFKAVELGPSDLPEMLAEDSPRDQANCERAFAQGHLCIGLRVGSELAAYTWADPSYGSFGRAPFPLQPHEAYLYDTYTFRRYRGHGLAPYLRYQMYLALRARGKNVFYSVSDYFNRPAIRFKLKLNAQFARLCLHLTLRDGRHYNWVLWKHQSRPRRATT